mgnify:CR=1 FL=1
MEDCVFCKIIKGDIPSKKVYEDDDILAFYDINPIAKVHVLVIPKKHITSLLELKKEDKDLLFHIFNKINEIAEMIGVAKTGFRVISNVGEDSGQAVKHLHFHILGGEKLPTR